MITSYTVVPPVFIRCTSGVLPVYTALSAEEPLRVEATQTNEGQMVSDWISGVSLPARQSG
jgi:hypothetical protein